jgi:hypothetical protein
VGAPLLMEFRDDPNDKTGVVLFADHCLRIFNGAQAAVELVSARIAGKAL